MKPPLTFILFVLVCSANLLYSQPGYLDPSFGSGGKVQTGLGGWWRHDMAIHLGDKILIAFGGGVVRYNADGSADSSFGISGQSLGILDCQALAVLPDEKILVAGFRGPRPAIVKLNSNGSVDSSFNNDGLAESDGYAKLAVQPDGKIILGSEYFIWPSETGTDLLLTRYNADGNIDSLFGANGTVITDFFEEEDRLAQILVQPDQKILVVGWVQYNDRNTFSLIRYNPDGTLDSEFGAGGKVICQVGPESYGSSIVLQSDGKIIAAGSTIDDTELAMIIRFHPNGSLDETFGNSGIVLTTLGESGGKFSSVCLQSDGKIIGAGDANYLDQSQIAVARYNTDGSPDAGFGSSGIVITGFENEYCVGDHCALTSDGRIVVSGLIIAQENDDVVLAKYLTETNTGNIAEHFSLGQPTVYSNPIGNNFTIEYLLATDEKITIRLFDVQGKLINTFFVSEKRSAGIHKEVLRTPENLASGNYFLTVSTLMESREIMVFK